MGLTVHTHTASEAGLSVNAYLLEGEQAVVAIDTSLLVSDSRAFAAMIEAVGKPLLAVFITHAHPDHFNGAGELALAANVPVYATPLVTRTIHEVADAKRAQWSPTYGTEWPSTTYYPDSTIEDGQTIALDGILVRAHELGPGESHADGYFDVRAEGEHGAVAFIGDVAFHGTHSYLSDGHTAAWLANVARLSADLADAGRLYPGHGAPGGVELFDAQRAYLDAYRTAVRELAGGRPTMTEDAKVELARRMTRLRPDAPLGWLLPLGADPVAAELAAEASSAS